MKYSPFLRGCAIAALLTLPACDGGVGVGTRVHVPGVDISTDISVGNPITTSGEVTVTSKILLGGVAYDGTLAEVTMDGRPAEYSDLKSGQIVSLEGRYSSSSRSGTADTIVQQTTAQGSIESVDSSRGRLVVLGQVVRILTTTRFGDGIDPANLSGLEAGELIAVSGLLSDAGEIQATRIDHTPQGASFQVIGRVSNVDTLNRILHINGLLVDFSDAVLVDVAGTEVTNGSLVVVRGSLSGGIFRAQQILRPIGAYDTPQVGVQSTTVTFNNTDFRDIQLSGIVHATIERDADYSLRVKLPTTAVSRLNVEQDGEVLSVGSSNDSQAEDGIEVTVSLPQLDRLTASGVTSVMLRDLDQPQLTLSLSGISTLISHAVRIGQLALTTDGVSYVDLVNSDPIGTAGIDLSGTSYVTLNLDQGATVSGTLAGVSSLLYYGSDVTISLSNTPTTSVVHIGDTKY